MRNQYWHQDKQIKRQGPFFRKNNGKPQVDTRRSCLATRLLVAMAYW